MQVHECTESCTEGATLMRPYWHKNKKENFDLFARKVLAKKLSLEEFVVWPIDKLAYTHTHITHIQFKLI